MPTWGDILSEIDSEIAAENVEAHDFVRRKYMTLLHKKTGRNVILYASAWTQTGKAVNPGMLSIVDEDLQGIMEVVHGLKGGRLDMILHSPGGSPTAAEAIVDYLRSKFDDIRIIIPQAAMSAATSVACSADVIVMGKHSSIGPTDPQLILQTKFGSMTVPAQDVIDEFRMAQKESATAGLLGAWFPILEQYGPSLLTQCDNAICLSRELVSEWLSRYMFAGRPDAGERAEGIAAYLSDHRNFKSHSRHINRDKAKKCGLVVEDLEDNQELQDLVLSVYHATMIGLSLPGPVKIIENHMGKAFIKDSSRVDG